MSGLAAEAESGPSPAASPAGKGNGKRRANVDTGQLSFEDLLWTRPETPCIVEPTAMPVVAGEHPTISGNYRITDKDRLGKGNQKAKFRDNVRAIELLRKLEAEGHKATPEEQSVLVKYTGWGGMPQAFDYANRAWEEEYEELEKMLTEEEYDSARASTLNAHYTSPDVIRFMYAVLGRMGFKGGRVLEPSLGIGYFLCLMPDEMLSHSRLSGIELDSLSGRIAKQLCPDADIRVMGFETARFPVNFFDLAVSNVPFGDYKLHDPLYRKHKFSIHEYFFAKSLDLVRPGGIVAFITSRYLMDRTDPGVRKYIYERADLLGAVRLPCTAFKEIANTEVTSDIVFLRKREEGGIPGDGDWLEAVPCEVGDSEDAHINEYFVKNPHMMLGKLAWECGMYGRFDLSLKPDGRVLTEALNGVLHLFPQDIFETEAELPLSAVDRAIPSPDSVKEGAFVVHEGRLYRSIAGSLVLQELPATTAKRVEKMVRLRDTARQLLHDEMTTADDAGIDFVRIQLNSIYDRFVKDFGHIHSRANKSAFSEDPDYPLLLSLELYDEESKKAEKAEVFSRRVIHPVRKVERVETVKEAFLVTLNELGRVDFDRMSSLTGKSEPDVRDELEGLIFRNPEGGWEPADQYLSGNVRKKLEIAELAAATDAEFRKNYEALRAVQPKDIDFAEIRANLGASWIPARDVAVFINELVDVKDACDVAYSPVIGTWTVEISSHKRWEVGDSVNNTTKWGTARCNAVTLIRDALNNRMSTVRDYEDDKPVINEKETEAAREKQLLVREHFKEWLWKDPERRERLARVYNATFNCLRARTFDGSHLNLPGMSTHLTLMKHQKDAIWRIIQTGTTLLDHIVGAGKAQPLDAKVLTPTGWRLMGAIKPGDQVISVDGKPTVVRGVFPQGEKDIYRVTFSDGSATECCDEHLWLTQTYVERGYSQNGARKGKDWECAKPKVRQLSEIRATLLAPHLDAKNHSIPLVQAVQFPHREMPIAPYLMGVLLGDGCFTGTGVTITAGDDEIIDECAKLLPETMKVRRISSRKRCPTWSLINKERSRSNANSIKNALHKFHLWGLSSSEKFIPDSYLFNDVESRIELLRGLMDTDGSVNNRGTSCYFYTTSLQLAQGAKALVQSLGGTVSTRLKRPTFLHKGERRKGKVCFVLCIVMQPHINPFKLSRKAVSVVPKTKYAPIRYIVDVVCVGRKQAQCILVEDPSHLYVTDDFIVTHNTFVMISAAMEMRRLGLISKAMITVPNHLLEQWGAMFLRLYPMANVLIAGHDDFTPARRKAFLGKIVLNHWDAVIIAHSSFEKIPLSAAVIASHMEGRIRELEEAILSMREENSGSRIVKELEKAKKRLAEKLQERLNEAAKDDGLTFEEIGVDMLFVDEADLFKNLFIVTKMSRIAGLPNADSKRAFDLSMKSQWLLRRRKPVVFATGTPVSNTIAEMYTMQRYQQPEMLVEHNISHFDSWAATFGEVVTSLEIAPDGSGYRMRSRFARFVNVPELLQMYWQVADVQTDATLQLEKPKLAGGKPIVVVAPASDVQKMYIKSLVKRAEALRAEHIDPRLDNMLKITTDGRKAALDMRLVDTLADDFEISKVNACVQKIYEEWIDMEELKGTQLVFCDLSTPRGDGFSVYEDIREKLVGKGIPREEIAFIHEADTDQKKKTLFVRVNFGRVRVLIGSTEKMGAGTNVQRLLGAEHHLDVPWRPRDVEQREGRILRQGNTHKTVRVYRYVTEGSFDSYIWQAVEAKGRFIAQLRSNQVSSRVVEDVEGVVLSYAEVKALASGNPLVMEKFKIDLEVQRLETLRSQHSSERYRLEYEVSALPARIENYKQAIEKRTHDLGVRRMPDPFRMEIDGTLYTERKYAGDKIIGLANLNKGTDAYERIGSYAGFDLYIRTHANGFAQPLVIARGLAEHKGNVSDSDVGTVNSLDFALRGMETSIAKYSSELAEMEKRLTGLTVELEKPFPHEERLRELLKKQYEINKELDIDKRDSADSAEEVAVITEKAA